MSLIVDDLKLELCVNYLLLVDLRPVRFPVFVTLISRLYRLPQTRRHYRSLAPDLLLRQAVETEICLICETVVAQQDLAPQRGL